MIGLGYVGLPVAVAFGKHARAIGFDIHTARIAELQAGYDRTGEVTAEDLAATNITYTHETAVLREADFHIVAVPTPVDDAHQPDLTPVERASETVGAALKKGDIVVYESTVYPGVTEEICVPILERVSGLRCGVDFTVGYSPERINPGDKEHTFTKIKKVVSGQDAATLEIVAAVIASTSPPSFVTFKPPSGIVRPKTLCLFLSARNHSCILAPKPGVSACCNTE